MPLISNYGEVYDNEFEAARQSEPSARITVSPLNPNPPEGSTGSDYVDQGNKENSLPKPYTGVFLPYSRDEAGQYNWSVPRVISEPLGAAKAFTESAMSVGQQSTDERPPEELAPEIAMQLLGVGMATAPFKPGLGLFGGRFSKQAVEHATSMEQKGYSPVTIKEMTGLERGAEGMWRKEFSDKSSVYTGRFKETLVDEDGSKVQAARLSEVLKHDELYKIYPEAGDIPVFKMKQVGNDPDFQGMFVVQDTGQVVILLKDGISKEEARNAIIHEIQHYIQYKEGFSTANIGGIPKILEDRVKGLVAREKLGEERSQRVLDLNSRRDKLSDPMMNNLNDMAHNLLKDVDYETYRKMAAEVEAFNTGTRIDYSPKQIRSILGKETEDVPRSQQVIGDNEGHARYGSSYMRQPPDNVTTFRRPANDNMNTEPLSKALREHFNETIQKPHDEFIKKYDALHEFGTTLKGDGYTEINIAKYNKMGRELSGDGSWENIKYDPEHKALLDRIKKRKENKIAKEEASSLIKRLKSYLKDSFGKKED